MMFSCKHKGRSVKVRPLKAGCRDEEDDKLGSQSSHSAGDTLQGPLSPCPPLSSWLMDHRPQAAILSVQMQDRLRTHNQDSQRAAGSCRVAPEAFP
jgi:hypothetical protein